MRIEVVHGRHDFDAARPCEVCRGAGTVVQLVDDPRTLAARDPQDTVRYVVVTCPRCGGRGSYVWFNAYAYECPYPVAVGDIVVVPPNDARAEQEATVIRLGSPYMDSVQTVLGVIPKDQS